MNRKLFVCFFGAVVLVAAGCKKPPVVPEGAKETVPAKFDACGLITKEEIQSIQGSPIRETKSTTRGEGAFRASQCIYIAEEFVKSVSLAVTQRNPDVQGARTPKDFWQETFGRFSKGEETPEPGKEGGEEEEKKKKRPPRKIDGLGDEAYWSSGITSALHVLKNDTIIYISLGGPDNDETKLNKSKALVEKALARL